MPINPYDMEQAMQDAAERAAVNIRQNVRRSQALKIQKVTIPERDPEDERGNLEDEDEDY